MSKQKNVCPVCNHSYYQNRKTLVYECECNTTALRPLHMETREMAPYFMKETVSFLNTLYMSKEQLEKLVQLIEAEKEESWCDGYEIADNEINERDLN